MTGRHHYGNYVYFVDVMGFYFTMSLKQCDDHSISFYTSRHFPIILSWIGGYNASDVNNHSVPFNHESILFLLLLAVSSQCTFTNISSLLIHQNEYPAG